MCLSLARTTTVPHQGEVRSGAWHCSDGNNAAKVTSKRKGAELVERVSLILMALIGIIAASNPASAQDGRAAKIVPLDQAKMYLVPAAQLMRVDDGVFELEVGKTIDLTNRKILLTIQARRRGRKMECCDIRINGDRLLWHSVGHRFDLKTIRVTRDVVADKTACFLDLVDLVTPKGGKWIATFRLACT